MRLRSLKGTENIEEKSEKDTPSPTVQRTGGPGGPEVR